MNPSGITGERGLPGVRFHFGGIVVDAVAHTLTRDGLPQAIEPKAFAVLLVLLRHADELVEHETLLDAVWGHRHVTPGVLTRAIAQLRAALDDHPHQPRFIQTQHALGYRFIGELEAVESTGPVDPPPAPGPQSVQAGQPSPEPAPVGAAATLAKLADPPASGETTIAPLPVARDPPDLSSPHGHVGMDEATPARVRGGVKSAWFAAAVLLLIAMAAFAWFNRGMLSQQPADASVAVLPFTSLSDNPDDRYFAQGLAVEMHNALAGMPGLQVAAVRPGASQDPPDIEALGRRLGVATVLDASVRRDGDRLRVNARLSDTATGFTLWSRSFDRKANDVFAVQREIANQVVHALPGVLKVDPRALDKLAPTHDLSAYEAYLKGQQLLLGSANDGYLDQAIGLFGEALAADPNFARAQAGICRARIIRFEAAHDTPAFDQAQDACMRAATMDPALREVSLALGELHRARGDYVQANEFYTEALEDFGLRPAAYIGLARVQSVQGNNDLALEYFELARKLRPGDAQVYRERGYHQYLNDDLDGAIESFRTATTLRLDDPSLWSSLGGLYLSDGDNVRAADAFQQSLAIKPSYAALSNLGTLRYAQGAYADAARLYRQAADLDPTDFRIWGNIGDALAAQPATAGQAQAPYRHAVQLAQDYLTVKDDDAQAQALLGFYYARLGDAAAALDHISKAEALATERGEVAFIDAQSLVLLGDTAGARKRLVQARREGIAEQRLEASPVLHELLAGQPRQ
ncbi:tetratricopeptide repeat protein [Lysobacter sp. A286]